MKPRPVRKRPRVLFPIRKMATVQDNAEDTLDEALRITELSSDEDTDDSGIPFPGKPTKAQLKAEAAAEARLPPWLHQATLNLFEPEFRTASFDAQQQAMQECLPFLRGESMAGYEPNSYGIPHFRRQQHIEFLKSQLGPKPGGYVAVDASRPWFFYWTMAGLSFLGEDVSGYREQLIETVCPLQNPTGGFGGGHGQLSHCAGTYATILALACVDGLDVVDRKAMWHWLGSIKQADGGFQMALGAEEDIRGAYCAMTIITILNLPLELPPEAPARKEGLEKLTDCLGEWVGRCQTYEGGIGGAPTNEAHGAYAFCALACLCILDAPHVSIPKYLDAPALLSWLAARQTQPEGGFQGRAEKLVDACYSHWIGGCWSLIQAAVQPTVGGQDCWNRGALIRYLLTCAQQPWKKGGMRDKPSTRPDAYHTCYSIAGLSHAQNFYRYDSAAQTIDKVSGRLTAAFNWSASGALATQMEDWKIDEVDVVEFVHPVFVVPMEVVQRARERFQSSDL